MLTAKGVLLATDDPTINGPRLSWLTGKPLSHSFPVSKWMTEMQLAGFPPPKSDITKCLTHLRRACVFVRRVGCERRQRKARPRFGSSVSQPGAASAAVPAAGTDLPPTDIVRFLLAARPHCSHRTSFLGLISISSNHN